MMTLNILDNSTWWSWLWTLVSSVGRDVSSTRDSALLTSLSLATEHFDLMTSAWRLSTLPVSMAECRSGRRWGRGVSGGLGRISDWHLSGDWLGVALERSLAPRLSWLLCFRILFSFFEGGYFSWWYLVRRLPSLEFLLCVALMVVVCVCLSGWIIIHCEQAVVKRSLELGYKISPVTLIWSFPNYSCRVHSYW